MTSQHKALHSLVIFVVMPFKSFSLFQTSNISLLIDSSDFIWDFGKLPFLTHLGKYFIKIGQIRAKIHEIGKIKAIFGLGMTPIYGLKNGQIKSLDSDHSFPRFRTVLLMHFFES